MAIDVAPNVTLCVDDHVDPSAVIGKDNLEERHDPYESSDDTYEESLARLSPRKNILDTTQADILRMFRSIHDDRLDANLATPIGSIYSQSSIRKKVHVLGSKDVGP